MFFSAPLKGCGCPVDTSAKQKHRPTRQGRFSCRALARLRGLFSYQHTNWKLLQTPLSPCGDISPFRGDKNLNSPINYNLNIQKADGEFHRPKLLVVCVRHKSNLTSSLDSCCKLSLVVCTSTCYTARKNLCSF